MIVVILMLLSLGYGFLRDIFPIRTVQILYSPECKHKAVLKRLDGIDLVFFVIVDGRKVYASPDFAPKRTVDFEERLVWDKSGTVVVLEVIGRRLFGYDTKRGRPLSDSELLLVEYAPEPALREYGFEGEWPREDSNTHLIPILFLNCRLPDPVIPAEAGIRLLILLLCATFSALFNLDWYYYNLKLSWLRKPRKMLKNREFTRRRWVYLSKTI